MKNEDPLSCRMLIAFFVILILLASNDQEAPKDQKPSIKRRKRGKKVCFIVTLGLLHTVYELSPVKGRPL